MKTLKPHGIKTPKTAQEFRNNLSKYFVTYGGMGIELMFKPEFGETRLIEISKLNSLSDLYDICEGEGTPQISPKVHQNKDVIEFMEETNQSLSTNGFFEDEKNYDIIHNQNNFMMDYTPLWVKIDNHIYREFFYISLGNFSGYTIIER